MSPRNKREVLYEILAEYGYSGWVVIEPNPLKTDATCILCNFTERRKAEVAIPDRWFEDPRRYNAIGELIKLAIDYSPTVSPAAAQDFFLLVGQTNHSALNPRPTIRHTH